MFETNTLFILGAGASTFYGYPLGKQLIKDIIQDMKDEILIPIYPGPNSPPYWNENDSKQGISYDFSLFKENIVSFTAPYADENFTRNIRFPKVYAFFTGAGQKDFFRTAIENIDVFKNLKQILIDYDPISIDAFLRDSPSNAEAGKIMIIYSLLKREDPSKFNIDLAPQSKADNWYSLLLNDLLSGCAENPEKVLENNIRLSTFNYDVSLDVYLRSRINMIENLKNNIEERTIAEKLINKLQIKHIYGQVYSPDDNEYGRFRHEANDSRPLLNSDLSSDILLNLNRFKFSLQNFQNIKTMYDERAAEKEGYITSNRDDLTWAKEIIFIGFGFDPDNLNILGLPDMKFECMNFFANKTIRYLNYKGQLKSLAQEFRVLETQGNAAPFNLDIRIIPSEATSISSAYLNDFKKYLFK